MFRKQSAGQRWGNIFRVPIALDISSVVFGPIHKAEVAVLVKVFKCKHWNGNSHEQSLPHTSRFSLKFITWNCSNICSFFADNGVEECDSRKKVIHLSWKKLSFVKQIKGWQEISQKIRGRAKFVDHVFVTIPDGTCKIHVSICGLGGGVVERESETCTRWCSDVDSTQMLQLLFHLLKTCTKVLALAVANVSGVSGQLFLNNKWKWKATWQLGNPGIHRTISFMLLVFALHAFCVMRNEEMEMKCVPWWASFQSIDRQI